MDNLPLITIITVVYNNATALEKTIKSVLSLKCDNIDYIIIDGASTDNTVNVIKSYESRLKCWISEADEGIYDAMNKGWKLADDDSFIIYLGAGDYIINLPDLQKYKGHNIIYGKVWIGNKYLFDTTVDFRLRLINAVHHQALLIKKNVHFSPPFSLKFPIFADFDFNQRLYKAGFNFMKDPLFCSFAMEGGVSSGRQQKEMLEVVENNYGKVYVIIAKIYYSLQNLKNYFTNFSP